MSAPSRVSPFPGGNRPTLYVSDLDGTLLGADHRLSAFAVETLNDLIGQGLLFTVASARSSVSMREVLRGLALKLPVIEHNGASISDFESGRHLHVVSLESGLALGVLARVQALGGSPFICTHDGQNDRVCYGQVANGGMRGYVANRMQRQDPRFHQVEDFLWLADATVTGLTLIDRMEPMLSLQGLLAAEFGDAIQLHLIEERQAPGWFWLLIAHPSSRKETAIRSLQARLGLEGAELVVFGDQLNDLGMFQIADRAYAVADAVPELLRVATDVLDHCDDPVVHFLLGDGWGVGASAHARHAISGPETERRPA